MPHHAVFFGHGLHGAARNRRDKMNQAYEVRSPSFSDMNLEAQIDAGINDWCAEGASGHQYFGQSKAEAEAIRASYANR
jgi:hypothetical protein